MLPANVTPVQREQFLREACEDEHVRGEVESLLRCEDQADSFLEAPALEVTAEAFAEGRARSMFGRVLGHYEIVTFLGAGGMGEVYRARDSRIGRDVAVKLLPPALAGHPERLRRFEQEARAAGALNHPNILTIYDVGVQTAPCMWSTSYWRAKRCATVGRGSVVPAQGDRVCATDRYRAGGRSR